MHLKEEAPATPATTPITPVMERISVPTDSTPKHTTPKIMVHKPSGSSQSGTSGARTIDEVLAYERRVSSPEALPSAVPPESLPAAELPDSLPDTGSPSVSNRPSAIPQLTAVPTGAAAPGELKVKKSSLYLRKARNLAARKSILKITLGRKLAFPTKQALRKLAHGEDIIIDDAP